MSEGPRLRFEPSAPRREGDAWWFDWRVANLGARPVRILETWLPHRRFRGDSRAHDLAVAPGAAVTLALGVRGAGEAGEVVENAFLILRLEQDGARWRVLARVTVRFDGAQTPRPEVVVVTSQPVGFSGVPEEGGR